MKFGDLNTFKNMKSYHYLVHYSKYPLISSADKQMV